jgi:hypothetical protein
VVPGAPNAVRSLNVTNTGQVLGGHRDSYPGVAAWLEGADPAHWWVRLLDVPRDPGVTPSTVADKALEPLEALVQAVRGASPAGMSDFVASRFRDADPANLLSARLELLCAAGLAVRQVPFAFVGKGEPDLKWGMEAGARGWLEIHRGAFNVFDDLQQDLDRELEARDAILRVRLGEWPLEVRDRNLLRTRISRAIDAAVADGTEQVVPMPEISPGATGVIETGGGRWFLLGRVLVETPGFWPSDGYLAAAELVMVSGYGLPAALPAPNLDGAGLIALGARTVSQLQQRRAAVTAAPATLAEITANAQALLGANTLLLPHLTPPDVASVQAAFGESAAMQAADRRRYAAGCYSSVTSVPVPSGWISRSPPPVCSAPAVRQSRSRSCRRPQATAGSGCRWHRAAHRPAAGWQSRR